VSKAFHDQNLRFYMTENGPCPYLDDHEERKIFAHLTAHAGPGLHDAMSRAGFRRSQNVIYRPACVGCDACQSCRIDAVRFTPNKSQRRTLKRNADLICDERPAEATQEQFALLKRYLAARHPVGGMNEMVFGDYAAMTEEIWARTRIFEYREPGQDGERGRLVAAALSDWMSDGVSMVYSFFDPDLSQRSLGVYMICQHAEMTRSRGLPYVYLGYWVPGSPKMGYKTAFQPLEILRADGWGPWRGENNND